MPGVDSLQFEQAEFDDPAKGPRCTLCRMQSGESYFHLAGEVICPACAGSWQEAQRKPSSSKLMRGFVYALGAAIGGAILMAVVTEVTGYQFALVSIAVGYLVAKALLKGTGGLGGRRCQVLAVVLTYFAVTTSFVPLVVRGLSEAPKTPQTAEAQPESRPSTQESAKGEQAASPAALAIGLALIVAISLASPFLILGEGFSGIINALIIFFALSQAWRMTKADERALTGPFSSGPAGDVAPPNPATS